jgi:hypothetical protein
LLATGLIAKSLTGVSPDDSIGTDKATYGLQGCSQTRVGFVLCIHSVWTDQCDGPWLNTLMYQQPVVCFLWPPFAAYEMCGQSMKVLKKL